MTAILNAYLICSIKMTFVALAFLIISPLLSKRYKIKWQYYAWLIIIIGFVIPVRPQPAVPNEMNIGSQPILSSTMQTPEYIYKSAAETVPALESPVIPISGKVSIEQIITALWLAGAIFIIVRHVIRHCRFKKALNRWSHKIGDYGKLKIIGCSIIGSPMMAGFIHPTIILPNKDYTEDELGFIIRHEMIHYKRKDLWYKCVLVIAQALHWFNPIIYFVSHRVTVLCELSCDEAVMKNADAYERKKYSQAILSSAMFQAGIKTEFITNFTGGKKLMTNRIQAITSGKRKKANVIILLLACLLTSNAGVVLANTDSTDKAETNPYVWNFPPSNFLNKYSNLPLITPKTEAEIEYYAKLNIIYDPNKNGFCYNGELVGLLIDMCRNEQCAILLNYIGEVNIKIGRDPKGNPTGVKVISDDVSYELKVFDRELDEFLGKNRFDKQNLPDGNISAKYPGVPLITPSTQTEIDYYADFGIVYDPDKDGYCYNGSLVGLFIDKCRNGQGVIFLSENGEVNIKIKRELMTGKLLSVETLSDDADSEIGIYFREHSLETAFWTTFLNK